jgi:hypothetical protein
MPRSQIKNLTTVFAISGISIVTITALMLCGCHGPAAAPANPPIIIVGGTIRGTAASWNQDTNQNPETAYIGQSPNSTLLYPMDVTGAPSAITDKQGWAINFYDDDSNGNLNKVPAVMLCSDENCQHSSVDQTNNYVYIRIRQGSIFEQAKAGELHFHDLGPNCDDYPKSRNESSCDALPQVGFITGGSNGTETIYPCGPPSNPRHCKVYVGAPSQ